jgi:3-deoxy-7-phosphoheptulonate synthase
MTGQVQRADAGAVSEAAWVRAREAKTPYRLASREGHPADTVITLRPGVELGGRRVLLMAGPCAVESENQLMAAAEATARAGGRVLRGGAFKPRTSPYSFQGLGEEGLRLLELARRRFGLAIVTEAMDDDGLERVAEVADMIQIGARNMQNYSLLRAAGRTRKPVLLKRGMWATLEEWLLAAEYVLAGGNHQVALCERGIRTFARETRNTLDLSCVPLMKTLTHLPVVVDPSHATGARSLVAPMARAAVAAGADGVLVEIHPDPESAWSDGAQSLSLPQFQELSASLPLVARALGRHV